MTSLRTTSKRRQRAAKKPRTANVLIRGAEPLAQISIYDDLTLITRRHGVSWRQYPIDPSALAQVLARVPTASGLLPRDTLGTGRVHGQPFFVVYVPPRVTTLRMEHESFTIPLPPLIWGGCKADYRVYALADLPYPSDTRLPLMNPPFPNTYRNGSICWGSSDPRPPASPQALGQVLKLFLEDSYFNLHVANGKSVAFPNSVVARWQELVESKADCYPLDDLMPAECQLGWLLGGGPWGGG